MPDKKKKRDPLIHDQAVPGAIAAPIPASTGDGDGSNHDYTKTGEPPPPFASTPNKPLYPDMPQWQTPIMLIRGRQGKVSAKNLPGLIDEDKPKPTHKHKAKGKPTPKKKKQKSASHTIQAKDAKEAGEKLHKLLIDAFKQHLRKQLEKNSIQQAVKPVIKNDNASDNLNANSFLAPNNTNIPESTAHKIPTAYDIAEEENKRQRFIEMLQQLSGDQSDADKFSILSDPNKLHIEIDPNLKAAIDSAHIEPPTDIIEVDAYGTGHIGPAERYQKLNGRYVNLMEACPVVMFRVEKKKNRLAGSEAYAVTQLRRSKYHPDIMNEREDNPADLVSENPIYHLDVSSLLPNRIFFTR